MKYFGRAGLAAAILGLSLATSARAQNQTAGGAKAAAPAEAQPTAPPLPARTEISRFDNWIVTCDEFTEPAKRRFCHADLQISKSETGQILLVWTLAPNTKSDVGASLQTPTGVTISSGVELHYGEAGLRKIPFATCEPGRCTATFGVDAALLHDLGLVPTAQIVLLSSNGARVEFGLPLKGLDKAVAALGR